MYCTSYEMKQISYSQFGIKFKMIIGIVLSVLLASCFWTITVFASDKCTQDGFHYYINEAEEVVVFGYTGDKKDVEIPAMIEGMPVTIIDNNSSSGAGFHMGMSFGNVKSIIIPDGIVAIEGEAFGTFYDDVQITIPNSVIYIGEYAFGSTAGYFHDFIIHCPSGSYAEWYAIEHNLKYACRETSLDGYQYDIYEDNTITISGYIGNGGDITIPVDIAGGRVTRIGEEAFSNCMNLTSVVIPDGITEIEDAAFQWCPNLKYITIPADVTSIGKNAFGREVTIYCVSGSYARKYATKNFLHYITETGFDSANLAVGAVAVAAVIMIVGTIAIVSKRKKRTDG